MECKLENFLFGMDEEEMQFGGDECKQPRLLHSPSKNQNDNPSSNLNNNLVDVSTLLGTGVLFSSVQEHHEDDQWLRYIADDHHHYGTNFNIAPEAASASATTFMPDVDNSAPTINSMELSDIEKEKFTCPLCCHILRRPVTLDCRHIFCYSCLQLEMAKEGACPLGCNQESNMSEFTENLVLGSYLDQLLEEIHHPDHEQHDHHHRSAKDEQLADHPMTGPGLLENVLIDDHERTKALDYRQKYQSWRKKFHFGARGEFSDAVKLSASTTQPMNALATTTTTTTTRKSRPKKKPVVRKTMSQHVTQTTTTNKIPPCPSGCGFQARSERDLGHHLDEIKGNCPHTRISCAFSHVGCDVHTRRCEMQQHLIDPASMEMHIQLLTKANQEGMQNIVPEKTTRIKHEAVQDTTENVGGPCWERILAEGTVPFPRYDHDAIVYQKKMFILGGVTLGGTTMTTSASSPSFLSTTAHENIRNNDLHILDFSTHPPLWSTPDVRGERPPRGYLPQLCLVEDVMYVIGASSDGVFMDVVYRLPLNLTQAEECAYHWECMTPTGDVPKIRYWNSLSAIGSQLYIFGGYYEGKRSNEVYQLDLSTRAMPRWSKLHIAGLAPVPRSSHSSVSFQDQIFIFGGYDGRLRKQDLYILDVPTQRWIKPQIEGLLPSVRYNHSCTNIGHQLYVFGGSGGNSKNDLWVLDLNQKPYTWSKPNVLGSTPSPRYWHTCVSLSKNELIVFGGYVGSSPMNDIYRLNIPLLENHRPSPPIEQKS